MNDLTDVKFFLASLIRPIIKDALREEIQIINTTSASISDTEPYGDFRWLTATCPGVPASTLRIKSASGEIPGVIKFGKRVLYEKTTVINWLRSQTRQTAQAPTEVKRVADDQINRQLGKKSRGKR